jgi:hypothetical protein
MKVKELSFGAINIDGKTYFKDIVIHKGSAVLVNPPTQHRRFRGQPQIPA